MAVSEAAERRVIMVKKILASGQPCAKCGQAEELLRKRGLWEQVTHVSIADERDSTSEGMQLAKLHGVELAPFFLIEQGQKQEVFTSVIKFAKVLEESASVASRSDAAGEGPAHPLQSEVEALAVELAGATPERAVETLLKRFGLGLKLAFSGAEDVVLIDMA